MQRRDEADRQHREVPGREEPKATKKGHVPMLVANVLGCRTYVMLSDCTILSRVGPIHSAVTLSVSYSAVRLASGSAARSMVPLAAPPASVVSGSTPEARGVDHVSVTLAPATEAPM